MGFIVMVHALVGYTFDEKLLSIAGVVELVSTNLYDGDWGSCLNQDQDYKKKKDVHYLYLHPKLICTQKRTKKD